MSLVDEVGSGLDGLAQLRAVMSSGRKPGILEALTSIFVEIEPGRAVFAGIPGAHAYNPIGSVHGGYAATLLDSACACAVHSQLRSTQRLATLDWLCRITSRSHGNRRTARRGTRAHPWAPSGFCRGNPDGLRRSPVCIGYLYHSDQ